MLQDRQGFMWFGTHDGLNRYDGVAFRRVSPADNAKGCSMVSCLFEAWDGKIWVGATDGLYVYDPALERMSRMDITTPDGYTVRGNVAIITQDSKGQILISSDDNGVYGYDKNTETFKLLRGERDMNCGKVNSLLFDSNDRLWVGFFGKGLFYSDDDLKNLHRVVGVNGEPYLTNTIVNDLMLNAGNIYVATDTEGMHRVNLISLKGSCVMKQVDGMVPIMRKLMMHDNQIWIGSESGIYIYDIVRGDVVEHLTHVYNDQYSISDNAVYSLYTDKAGGTWLGTYFGGIDYMSAGKISFCKYYRGRKGQEDLGQRVRELCAMPDGSLYVGSEDSGLCHFNPSTNTFKAVDGVEASNVHGLALDGNKLWIGTFSKGLKILDTQTGHITHYLTGRGNGLLSDYVFTIRRSLQGDIYIGTMSGLNIYNRQTGNFDVVPELHHVFIYNLCEDSYGNLWVATYSQGLYVRRASDGHWTHFVAEPEKDNSLPDNHIYGIYEDSKKNIWIMTQSGLVVYNPDDNSFRQDALGTGHLKGVVYQVVEDDFGRYWFTTNNGLYCIDGDGVNISRFTVTDGLPTNQFNYNSSLKTSDGHIYLGTIDGLVSFDPRSHSFVLSRWSPYISQMWLNGEEVVPGADGSPLEQSIFLTDELHLDSDQNSLSFHVVNLRYDCSPELGFKYRMEGLEDNWHHATLANGRIMYWNLPSGDYKLSIAPDDEELASEPGSVHTLKLSIATPFYKSAWAITFYLILAGVLIASLIRIYLRNKRESYNRLMEDYSREKERESYDSKIRFFTNVAHEIRTPLTLIKAPIDTLLRSKALISDPQARDDLDVINLNVDRLLVLANQLLDFRKMESGKFQINKKRCDVKAIIESLIVRFKPTIDENHRILQLDLPQTPLEATLDPEALTKIVSNLFTNAIKYGETYISLQMTEEQGNIILRMGNDGPVVAPDKRETIFAQFSRLDNNQGAPGIGIGLAYARSLAMMHDGSLVMGESETENLFVLTLPIDSASDIEADDCTDLEYMIKRNEEAVTLLIVEDNAEMRVFLEKKLIGHNYKVIKASDGQEALDILAENYVDLIVSDVMMPRIDGMELLRHVKADINFSHIPFILLTAKTRMEDKLSGLEEGADAYIEKPFSIEYLLATISTLLRNRERMRRSLENQPLGSVTAKGLSKVDEEFLRKINDTIRANFDNPDFAMEELIAAMGVSRTTFYRKIKGLLNLSPNDYIKLERLKQAAKLFSEGHNSVSEVCYMVGFSSPGYFTKCFQKQFGVSPKEFIAGKRAQ